MLVVFLSRKECVLYFSVVNYRACLWWAIWKSVLGITTKVTIIASITFVALALYIIYMVDGAIRFWPSVRITSSLSHMLFIHNALRIFHIICFLILIRLFESLQTLLAISTSVWVSTDTLSIIINVWHSMRVAHYGSLLGMINLRFKAIFSYLWLSYHFSVLRLPCRAFQIIASIILWNLGLIVKVK